MLLFEIATSVELFQEKLPRATIRCLQGTSFETKDAAETLELMFEAVTNPRESKILYVGPNVSKMLLDRQMEHTQSAQAFIGSLKVSVIRPDQKIALISIVHIHDALLCQCVEWYASKCTTVRSYPPAA